LTKNDPFVLAERNPAAKGFSPILSTFFEHPGDPKNSMKVADFSLGVALVLCSRAGGGMIRRQEQKP